MSFVSTTGNDDSGSSGSGGFQMRKRVTKVTANKVQTEVQSASPFVASPVLSSVPAPAQAPAAPTPKPTTTPAASTQKPTAKTTTTAAAKTTTTAAASSDKSNSGLPDLIDIVVPKAPEPKETKNPVPSTAPKKKTPKRSSAPATTTTTTTTTAASTAATTPVDPANPGANPFNFLTSFFQKDGTPNPTTDSKATPPSTTTSSSAATEKKRGRPKKNVADVDDTLPKLIPTCGICFEDIALPSNPVSCDHIFCFDCISKWLNNANFCPVCSKQIEKVKKIDKDGKISFHLVKPSRGPFLYTLQLVSGEDTKKNKKGDDSDNEQSGAPFDGIFGMMQQMMKRFHFNVEDSDEEASSNDSDDSDDNGGCHGHSHINGVIHPHGHNISDSDDDDEDDDDDSSDSNEDHLDPLKNFSALHRHMMEMKMKYGNNKIVDDDDEDEDEEDESDEDEEEDDEDEDEDDDDDDDDYEDTDGVDNILTDDVPLDLKKKLLDTILEYHLNNSSSSSDPRNKTGNNESINLIFKEYSKK
ncbi:hypothetical protein PPL_11159 [Heterostelium album PN500]|uniref:RING-type domain-containing protein n=1 Tax=Heterostelium pallidum (strain ATCC 26659 / Pp 5 / PN500) TaxID=670386 RepID=D3BTP9_HETP5|nr:hypothetical protein PPL_11159 [Heterostelium album PN500]EFA75085.1 hypothetical protein PPL_11159 [Heterostelium album PN500]|eukprot:XP_020427219.1 hypothetical protein PPL_11159 [Heterostelium album PN500]